MSQIDRVGTFKGYAVERVFGFTSTGKPQYIIRFKATEMYNEETKEWEEWDYEECEVVGYFILCDDKEKPYKSAPQIQKAFGWPGTAFYDFQDEEKYGEILVQFRVEENDYKGHVTLRAAWVDHADADPSRRLKKMETSEAKAVGAKFSKFFKNLNGDPKPKPVGKPTVKKATKKVDKPAKPTAAKPPRPGKDEKPSLPKTAVEDDAWDQVCEHVTDGVTDSTITETWQKTVTDLGGADAIDEADNWAGVRDAVLEILGTK